MSRLIAAVILLIGCLGFTTDALALSDAEVRQRMIQESISSYPGSCPCPYNAARNGSSCGRRSAYSRAGGYAPLCYAKDISNQMIAEYRRSHGL